MAVRLSPATPGAMGAGADLLTVVLSPVFRLGTLRVTVSANTASVFSARITPSGNPVITLSAEKGVALVANAGYSFVLPCVAGSTYNFFFTAAVTVNLFQIEEYEGD